MTMLSAVAAWPPSRVEPWRGHLAALAAAAGLIFAFFAHDAYGMARIWVTSSTFNHCALILPLAAWLVWQRRPELRRLAPTTWPLALLAVAAGAAAWLLGYAAGVALARHVGLLLMLEGAVAACLGPAVTRALLFPLAFAWFAVPFGEELVPPMQTLTAWLSMALLGLAGVPAHLEGVFITIPNGYFEVAEACAGVKFLIAMAALGALVANLCFRSWRRRAAFVAAALLIPVLANGVRAFATIYVAHLTDSDAAAGFDHVVYGGIFFALVIALTMAAGWPFFDRRPGDPWFDPDVLQPVPPARTNPLPIAAAAVAIAVAPLLWSAAIAGTAPPPPSSALPDVPGWERIAAPTQRPWRPHFAGADRFAAGRYRDAAGAEIDLAVAVYARQEEGRELVGFGQGAVAPDGAWAWTGTGPAPVDGRLDRLASHGVAREVATFYRVGDILTGSPAVVKLETARVRLLGGPQRAAAVLVSSAAPADGVSPRPAIDRFVRAMGSPARLADGAAGLPQGG